METLKSFSDPMSTNDPWSRRVMWLQWKQERGRFPKNGRRQNMAEVRGEDSIDGIFNTMIVSWYKGGAKVRDGELEVAMLRTLFDHKYCSGFL